jgi:hypothetical protein
MAQNPYFPRPGGNASKLNITAATVVKATPGTVYNVSVTTAGSTSGQVSDVATVAGVAVGNLVFDIPNTVGNYPINFPCFAGIVVTPGTGQVLSVSYN